MYNIKVSLTKMGTDLIYTLSQRYSNRALRELVKGVVSKNRKPKFIKQINILSIL